MIMMYEGAADIEETNLILQEHKIVFSGRPNMLLDFQDSLSAIGTTVEKTHSNR